MSDTLILGIATLVVGLIGTVFSGVMAYLMAKLAQQQHHAAVKVAEVKATLSETQSAQNAKLDRVAAQVEEVHKTTNGLTDKLMAATEAEALARGVKEEKEREAERKKAEGGS